MASFLDPHSKIGHLQRTMEKVYELSLVENPPLRFVVGEDSVEAVKRHLSSVQGEVEAYEDWSVGLREE